MSKAVRMGDIIFVETAEGYSVAQLYSKQKGGRRFRICEGILKAEEVKGLGVDPETGKASSVQYTLKLVNGEDYWCLLLEPVSEDGMARNLGKVPDDVVAQMFFHRTLEGTPFPDLSYDTIKAVRKAREERVFRERMLSHIDDTREIKRLLTDILAEMRTPKPAPKPRASRKKAVTDTSS